MYTLDNKIYIKIRVYISSLIMYTEVSRNARLEPLLVFCCTLCTFVYSPKTTLKGMKTMEVTFKFDDIQLTEEGKIREEVAQAYTIWVEYDHPAEGTLNLFDWERTRLGRTFSPTNESEWDVERFLQYLVQRSEEKDRTRVVFSRDPLN
ncbi:hypothetical protein D1872_181390 [compost metagenome]